MPTEKGVQDFVHTLEEGPWARWIRVAAVLVALVTISFTNLTKFRGLSTPEGMEQAVIAREIARGNGFSTEMLRPMALWQLKGFTGDYPKKNVPDTFHAPLNPWLNSFALNYIRDKWQMTAKIVVYPCDYAIAQVSIFFFLLAIWMTYLTAARLFDRRLATLAIFLVVLCDSFWQFALSGLPQMLMLFLFSAAIYALVRALDARNAGGRVAPWLILAGVLFGLNALAHPITIWIFLAALFYVPFVFKPRWLAPLLLLVPFLFLFVPWLIRNHQVCGDARGIAAYALLDGVGHSGSEWMRSMDPPLTADAGTRVFIGKVQIQAISQINRMFGLLGASIMAPVFFLSLFHPFKRATNASLRWGILLMAMAAFAAMCAAGLDDKAGVPNANNLYILFIPIMICYGLAFFLALWTRLEVNPNIAFVSLIAILFLVSAVPLADDLVRSQGSFNWPPYCPPVISVLNRWTKPNEILVSDVPWAVAWYADRKCLWLPTTVEDFVELTDYERLGSRLVGIYLTPFTGNLPFRPDLVYGEYQNWKDFILGLHPPKFFPLQYSLALPVHNECLFLTDHARWADASAEPALVLPNSAAPAATPSGTPAASPSASK